MENMENMENVQNTEPMPAAEPAPVVEPAPVADPAPHVDPAPAVDPTPESEPAPAPKQRKKMKKGTKVLAIILAVIVVLGAVAGIILNSPKFVAITSVKRLAKDALGREEISAIADAVDGGSFEAVFEGVKDEEGNKLLDTIKVAAKLYSSKDVIVLEDLNVHLDDEDLGINDFKLNANMYASWDKFYIQEEHILKGGFGGDLEDIAKDFEKSIFAYDSGSDYAIPDEDVYNAVLTVLENAPVGEDFSKDLEKLSKKLIGDVYEIICKHAEFESENDKVRLGGKKTKARVITISVDEKALANIYEDLVAYLEDSDLINDFLEEYDDYLTSTYNSVYGMMNGDEIDSVIDLYDDLIEELADNVDDTVDMIKDGDVDVAIELVTPALSNKLLKIAVKDGKDEMFAIDFGAKGVKKAEEISISVYEEEVASYNIKENSNKKYSASLSVYDEKILTVEVDRKKDTFKINADIDGTEIALKGELSSKSKLLGFGGKTVTLSISELTITNEYYDYYEGKDVKEEISYDIDFTFTIKTKDKAPKPSSDYEPISKIKDEDIEEWGERISEMVDIDFATKPAPEEPAPSYLSGTYENNNGYWFYFTSYGDFTLYDYYGSTVMYGTYSIHGNQIYLDYYSYENYSYESSWNNFSQGSDYIIFNGMYYWKQ